MLDAYRPSACSAAVRHARADAFRMVFAAIVRRLFVRGAGRPTVPPAAAHG